ncbi:hypothetical protein NBC2815_00709 [Xanthomonas fragariae]|nr:hypothetical protein NBC2815_00709 [Xanthomonas fragariae]
MPGMGGVAVGQQTRQRLRAFALGRSGSGRLLRVALRIAGFFVFGASLLLPLLLLLLLLLLLELQLRLLVLLQLPLALLF